MKYRELIERMPGLIIYVPMDGTDGVVDEKLVGKDIKLDVINTPERGSIMYWHCVPKTSLRARMRAFWQFVRSTLSRSMT